MARFHRIIVEHFSMYAKKAVHVLSQIIPLYFYHTNDLHSDFHQWSKAVSYLKKRRYFHEKKQETCLFVDIGDHVDRVNPVVEATRGKANVELLNEAGIQYVTIGNNEGITLSKKELNELYENATFQVLVANLFEQDGSRPSWAKPYDIMTTKEGIRVGFIGMTIPYYPFYQELGWQVKDPVELLPGLIQMVRERADIVILLSHLGYPQDREIAQKISGIDVILGSHTHHLLKTAEEVNGTLIGQCGRNSFYVGRVQLLYDKENKRIVQKEGYAVHVGEEKPSEETVRLLRELEVRSQSVLDETIADVPEPFSLSWTSPSYFANMLADGIKEWCGAEIAMVNSGLLLEPLHHGKITRKDIHRLCPHPVNPCLIEVKGSILKETIAQSFTQQMIHLPLKGFGFRGKKIGRMAFSGIDVDVRTIGDTNYVENIVINGKEVESNQTYALATADMFTFGPLFPGLTQSGPKKYFMPETIRDVLAHVLEKRFPYKP